jgi:hypothetical protein
MVKKMKLANKKKIAKTQKIKLILIRTKLEKKREILKYLKNKRIIITIII